MTIKISKITALLLCLYLLTAAPLYAAPKAPANNTALELAGRSSQYGSIKFLVSSTAINAIDTLGYMVWSHKKPNCTNTLNAENKSYVVNPIKDGCLGIGYTTPYFRGLTRVVQKEKCLLVGQKCIRFEGYTKPGGTLKPALEFWTLEKAPVAPIALKAWCSLFLLPPDYGFAVQIKNLNGKVWPHTFSPIRVKPVSATALMDGVPKDYAYVEDRAAFYFGDGRSSKSDDISDFFRGSVK